MVQYVHIYAAICIMIKLKVMFWELYTRIYFNVGTFKRHGCDESDENECLYIQIILF